MKKTQPRFSFNALERAPEKGAASAHAHHGELLQGVFEQKDGRLKRALVTLPLRSKHAFAVFTPSREHGVDVIPSDRIKAARAAELALDHLQLGKLGGRLALRSNIPVGHGYGSSSADVIATIRAVFDAFSHTVPAQIASQLAVAAESASDAIAFEESSILFAHREGLVVEYLGANLPPLGLISFKAAQACPISTTSLPRARYTPEEIQVFRCALANIRRALHFQDPNLLGHTATLSAKISQRHLPKSGFDRALEITNRHHACGLQVSHSGSLFGILLDASSRGFETLAQEISADLHHSGFVDVEDILITEGVPVP